MNKIIFFTSRFPFRTVGENFFESELNGIAQEFDEVYVVSCDTHESDPQIVKNLPQNVKAISAKTEQYSKGIAKGVFALAFNSFFWKELACIIKERHPFVQSVKSLVFAGSALLSIRRRFSYIAKQIDLSSSDDVIFAGYWLTYISRAILDFKKYLGIKKAKVVCRAHGSADVMNVTQPKRFYPFQNYLLDKLDAVFSVSNGGREYLRSKSKYPEKIQRVYIGSSGASDYVCRSRKPFTVMTCSNIILLKRVGLVGDAIRILKKSIPDIKWIHFGDGPLRNKLETDFADIADSVDFRGYTPHDEVLKYLNGGEASVFVSASATEGLPVSIIEAAAYSLPVVATDVGSTGEITISGVSGTLVPSQINATDLAREIFKYYTMSEDEYEKISRSAFELFERDFDCNKNAQLFTKALKEA